MKTITLTLPDQTLAQFLVPAEPNDKRDDATRTLDTLSKVIHELAIGRAQVRIQSTARATAVALIGTILPTAEFIPDISAAVEETPATPAVNVDV